MVWPCNKNQWALQDHPARNSPRTEEKGEAEEAMDRRHQGMTFAETQALAQDRDRWGTLVRRSIMQRPYDPGGLWDQ